MNKWIVFTGLIYFCLNAQASVKFATYNIRHFDSRSISTNKVELKKIIDKLDADFITVQEIVNTASFKGFLQRYYQDFDVVFSRCGGGGSQKIGFVYNKTKFQLIRSYEDARISNPRGIAGPRTCGRLRPALIGLFQNRETNKSFAALGLHLKAGGQPRSYNTRERQYNTLEIIVKELAAKGFKDAILMGDFNTTGYNLQDRDFHNFNDLLAAVKMETISEKINCSAYWTGKNRNDNIEESSVLDHIIYPAKFLGKRVVKHELHSHCAKVACRYASAGELGISYKEVTDHCPVSVTFD